MELVYQAIFMTIFGGGLVASIWVIQKIRKADTSNWW